MPPPIFLGSVAVSAMAGDRPNPAHNPSQRPWWLARVLACAPACIVPKLLVFGHGQADMMTFELIPVGPLWPLGLMLAEPAK
jgi:hypothetical protein